MLANVASYESRIAERSFYSALMCPVCESLGTVERCAVCGSLGCGNCEWIRMKSMAWEGKLGRCGCDSNIDSVSSMSRAKQSAPSQQAEGGNHTMRDVPPERSDTLRYRPLKRRRA